MMSKKMSKKVCFSPDLNDKPPSFHNHGSCTKVGGGQRKRVIGIWTFRMQKDSKFSPEGILTRIRAKFVRALRFVSIKRRSSSRKVSSSSSSLARSRSYADAIDSHRAEAVEDCIEFLNSASSSSLQRSNSVSASSC